MLWSIEAKVARRPITDDCRFLGVRLVISTPEPHVAVGLVGHTGLTAAAIAIQFYQPHPNVQSRKLCRINDLRNRLQKCRYLS